MKTVVYNDPRMANLDFGTDIASAAVEAANLVKFKSSKGKTHVEHYSLTYDSETEKRTRHDYTCDTAAIIHPELQQVMNRLACHLAILTEYHTPKRSEDLSYLETGPEGNEELEKFTLTGVSLSNHDSENYSVVLSGHRKLQDGCVTNLVSKLVKLNEESPYLYLTQLDEAVGDLETEVRLFLGGKQGTPEQLELDLKVA